jgi:hypothetical protein
MNPTQNQVTTTPPADITPADILRGAACYLELHGWIQGNYYQPVTTDPFPAACGVGAISMAAFGVLTYAPFNLPFEERRDFHRALDAVTDYLRRTDPQSDDPDGHELADDDEYSPYAWNDSPGRTAEQVITTLRGAADDYDWTHATEGDLETYAEHEYDNERLPTREGFLAWLGAR